MSNSPYTSSSSKILSRQAVKPKKCQFRKHLFRDSQNTIQHLCVFTIFLKLRSRTSTLKQFFYVTNREQVQILLVVIFSHVLLESRRFVVSCAFTAGSTCRVTPGVHQKYMMQKVHSKLNFYLQHLQC